MQKISPVSYLMVFLTLMTTTCMVWIAVNQDGVPARSYHSVKKLDTTYCDTASIHDRFVILIIVVTPMFIWVIVILIMEVIVII